MKTLSKELSDVFTEVADNEYIGIRKNYSGRSMYGKECFAVTGESFKSIIYHVLSYVRDYEDWDLIDEFTNWLRGCSADNMGRDVIIYNPYWKWPEE